MQPAGQHIKVKFHPQPRIGGIMVQPEALQTATVLEVSPDIKDCPVQECDAVKAFVSKKIEHSGETFILLDHIMLKKS